METSNFEALGKVAAEIFQEISKQTKTLDEKEFHKKARSIVFEKMPDMMKCFNKMFLNPSKDEIAFMTTQLSVTSGMLAFRFVKNNTEKVVPFIEESANSFQRYLRFKAETLEDNEKLLALIDANIN